MSLDGVRVRWSSALKTAPEERVLDGANGFRGIGDFNDELGIRLILQIHGDRVRRVTDIPEYPIALLKECAGGDEAGEIRSEQPKAFHRIILSGPDIDDVLDWNLQTARH